MGIHILLKKTYNGVFVYLGGPHIFWTFIYWSAIAKSLRNTATEHKTHNSWYACTLFKSELYQRFLYYSPINRNTVLFKLLFKNLHQYRSCYDFILTLNHKVILNVIFPIFLCSGLQSHIKSEHRCMVLYKRNSHIHLPHHGWQVKMISNTKREKRWLQEFLVVQDSF